MKTQTGKAALWLAATTISMVMLSANVWAAKPVDNDGDGFTTRKDCNDNDASINPDAIEICFGGVDENCDGLIDGDDPVCQTGSQELICYDGLDNDNDGLIDCADHTDCDGQVGGPVDELCAISEATFCADGFDNDADGLIDLADPDCIGSGGRLTVTHVSSNVLGIGPGDSQWNSTSSVTYAMRWVDDIEGLNAGGTSSDVNVMAIHDGSNIALMMTWADPDESRDVFQTIEFADRAAIMFNANRICHMGSENSPTNIWFWNAADNSVQNLLSGGLGTITHTPTAPVNYDTIQVVNSWANGVWQVVFSRSLAGIDPDYQYDMYAGDSALEVSFGTWDGGKQMRNGMKWISGIERMDIDP